MLYVCFECKKTFEVDGDLGAHKRMDCEAEPRCDQCGELCHSDLYLANHKKEVHTRPPPPIRNGCLFCAMEFSTSEERDNHMANTHRILKNYQ
jgi:DNA-directed RNA polymerase subunit RPC12/RpoP